MTGWHATELAGVRAADTVVVFGAGAVDLLAAFSARLRGASEVYSVDLVDERLDKAAELGFVAVDARQGDPVGQIRELRRAAGIKIHDGALMVLVQRPDSRRAHRAAPATIARIIRSFGQVAAHRPRSARAGPAADGRMSKSKMAVGRYRVAHEFGTSTTP